MKLLPLLRTSHELFVKAATSLQSPLLLAARFYWGWAFVQTGHGKVMNLEQTAAFFAELGLPLAKLNAFLAGSTECLGGALLLLGFAARPAAAALAFTMLVAYFTADMEAVRTIFSDPEQFLTAAPFLFLFASMLVLAFGPGALSIDRLVARLRLAPRAEARERELGSRIAA